MKRLAPYALMLQLSLISAAGFSQDPNVTKPKQFNSYPNVIDCQESELSKVFSSSEGLDIDFNFSNGFLFSGRISSSVVKYSNLQTAVVRSPFFNNSIFHISKLTDKDNSVSYVGRIINKDYFDGYELKRNVAGNYQLIKIETDRVIPDCRQN